MKLLLDSVILIDHFNGISQATEFIAKQQTHIGISAITRAEVLTGFQGQGKLKFAKQLLDLFTLYPITATEADLAASLRRMYRLKLPDAIQAAIAKQHKLKLVTRNTKDFHPKDHHFVMVPYHL